MLLLGNMTACALTPMMIWILKLLGENLILVK